MVSPIATSEMPIAAANSSGMSDGGDAAAATGPGTLRQHADDRHAVRRQVEHDRQPIATTTATRMPGVRGREPLEAQDDGQAQQADAQRPWVGQASATPWRNATTSSIRPLGIGREPEQLGQLADEDDDRETGQVAGPDRVRQQVGDEAELAAGRRQPSRARPAGRASRPGRWPAVRHPRRAAGSSPRSWVPATSPGPSTRTGEGPTKAYATRQTTVVYRPVMAGRPASSA